MKKDNDNTAATASKLKISRRQFYRENPKLKPYYDRLMKVYKLTT